MIGKSGHGSRPDLAKNPVIPASHIVCELDSALQNQMNAEETLTFSICVQKAGEIWNAIPDEAFFSWNFPVFQPPSRRKGAGVDQEDLYKRGRCTWMPGGV